MTRWQRITATKGRTAVFFGGFAAWLVVGILLSQEFLLGRPAGGYAAMGLMFVWLALLAVIEARWRRQDSASAN